MALFVAFLLVLSTATVRLYAFETQYECATKLNASDIPDGSFYLRLYDATEDDTNVSPRGTCLVNDQQVKHLDCICGENLRNQQQEIQDRLNRTCEYYDEDVEQISSPLGFCERSLTRLGRCVTFEPYSDDNSTTVYNANSLMAKIKEIDRILLGYFGVLDRTLVGVYLRTEGHRCQCLELYKRWLCATKLIFYTNSTDNATSSNVTSASMGEDGGLPDRLCPCIGICEDVLQSCPYYHPSRFQSISRDNSSSSNTKSIIYGGYPAFDCPRRNFCESAGRENCAYAFQGECFGPRGSHGFILTTSTSFTFIIFQSFVIYVVQWHLF